MVSFNSSILQICFYIYIVSILVFILFSFQLILVMW